jgi:isocitrate dehydrogenase
MPALIRAGGKGWGPDGKEADTKCVIPDSSYAGSMTRSSSSSRRTARSTRQDGHGAERRPDGPEGRGIRLPPTDLQGTGRRHHPHRRCDGGHHADRAQGRSRRHLARLPAKDAPIRDWVKLGVTAHGSPACRAIFWLDKTRAHDAELIKKVKSTCPSMTRPALTFRSWRRARPPVTPPSASPAAKTRSPSPATCCATT